MNKKINYKQLINEINSNDEEVVRSAIFKVGENRIVKAKPILIELLNSRNLFIRDAAAMSLGDLNATEVIPKIVELIQDPENENNRGSLIYALKDFDVRNYFLLFTDLIICGNFEVKEMSIVLIENCINKVEPDIIEKALEKLYNAKSICSKNRELDENNTLKYIDFEIDLIKSH